jgi:hypothetical protein
MALMENLSDRMLTWVSIDKNISPNSHSPFTIHHSPLIKPFTIIFLHSIAFILLQVTPPDTTGVQQAAEAATQELRLFDLIVKGGPIMIPLFLLAIFATFLFLERFFYVRRSAYMDPQFLAMVRERLLQNNIRGAIGYCATSHFPIARLIEKGLHRMGSPIRDRVDKSVTVEDLIKVVDILNRIKIPVVMATDKK